MVNIIERLVVYLVARSGDTRNCVFELVVFGRYNIWFQSR